MMSKLCVASWWIAILLLTGCSGQKSDVTRITEPFEKPETDLTHPSQTQGLVKVFTADSSVSLQSVDFIDTQVGMLAGCEEFISLTQDGGESWETLEIRDRKFGTRSGEYCLVEVRMLNNKTAVVLGQLEGYGSALFITHNLGKEWKIEEFPGTSLTSIGVLSNNFFVSGNQGKSSEIFILDNLAKLKSVWKGRNSVMDLSMTQTKGIAIGQNSLFLVTSDGQEWFPKDIPFKGNFVAITHSDGGSVAIAGSNGEAYHSSDDGRTWSLGSSKGNARKLLLQTENRIWTLDEGRVTLRSLDSWEVLRGLDLPARDIDKINSTVYIATENDVYRLAEPN